MEENKLKISALQMTPLDWAAEGRKMLDEIAALKVS